MNAQLALAGLRLSDSEELANRVTHGIGLVLSLLGAVVMTTVYGSDDPWRIAGCSVYLTSLIALYAMSTLSHCEWDPRRRSFFRALDQGAIYLLIAATYTPFSMAYLHTAPWWILLGLVLYFAGTVFWILALSAVPLTVLYPFAALTYVLVNLFAVVLLGEQLTAKGVAGTAFVLLGLFLVATSFEANHDLK